MSTATAAAVPQDHSFLWRRLHSLSGIFPVGVFLIEHLFSNSFALRGPEAYARYVSFLVGLPFLVVIETTFIFIPILYHSLFGVYIWWRGESNVSDYPWAGNWMYSAQRVTGLVTFAYILFHVWEQRFAGPSIAANPAVAYDKVASSVANPLVAGFYFLGISCACFHFAYGLWLFGCKWGITPGPRAQKFSGVFCAAVGVALASMGLATLGRFVFAR